MTAQELDTLLATAAQDTDALVLALQKRNPIVPPWENLKKQYEPLLHNIMTDVNKYPPLKVFGKDELDRVCFGLQKLAVRRWSQSLFSTPVRRNYVYDHNSTSQTEAVQLLEELLRTNCGVDKVNTERAKKLGKSCQFATVWHTYPKPTMIGEELSQFRLRATTYSEDRGYQLFPIFDENEELLCLSIMWTTDTNVAKMTTYTATATIKQYNFSKTDKWAIDEGFPRALEVFPVVYMALPEPVWGGDEGTLLVEKMEAAESYQGTYIKRNSIPTFVLDWGEKATGAKKSIAEESALDARGVIVVGKGGDFRDVTWAGATEALEARQARLRNAFFEQIQIPDTSFANMLKSNTSAENKELIFADSRASAEDFAGEFETMFFDEFEIVKKLASIMFPKYAKDFTMIAARSVITPYNVRTQLETAEIIATAPDAFSQETKIRMMGVVDDIESEKTAIAEESALTSQQI